jgi:3-phytase
MQRTVEMTRPNSLIGSAGWFAFLFRFGLASALSLSWANVVSIPASLHAAEPVAPRGTLHNESVCDQDDLCFWRNHKHPDKSTVIVSDKAANRLFVYDLSGNVKQTLEVAKPGNIDIRQSIRLRGEEVDLVAVNSRGPQPLLRLYSVERESGQLVPVDESGIPTRPNYGGCLGYDAKSERLWFYSTSEQDGVTQYELIWNDARPMTGREVRHWDLGKCEGAVVDDDAQTLYVSVEVEGVWRLGMLPEDQAPGEQILAVGQSGLTADLEGICLAKLASSVPVLVVSSQGANRFFVYERSKPYQLLGSFQIQGATGTDGIEFLAPKASSKLNEGLFGCHTDEPGHPILLSSWKDIELSLNKELAK